jgi:hypothetical protein
LVRGGVSYGNIYSSSDRIFGPALVAAYELESKYALYPRIAVDPRLLEELKRNELLKAVHHDLADETPYIQNLIRKGNDGIWFVDYIRAFERELDDPSMYPDLLREHRTLILDGAKRFSKLNGVMSKYLWLAVYHNTRVSELTFDWLDHYAIKRSDLQITPNDIPTLQELVP